MQGVNSGSYHPPLPMPPTPAAVPVTTVQPWCSVWGLVDRDACKALGCWAVGRAALVLSTCKVGLRVPLDCWPDLAASCSCPPRPRASLSGRVLSWQQVRHETLGLRWGGAPRLQAPSQAVTGIGFITIYLVRGASRQQTHSTQQLSPHPCGGCQRCIAFLKKSLASLPDWVIIHFGGISLDYSGFAPACWAGENSPWRQSTVTGMRISQSAGCPQKLGHRRLLNAAYIELQTSGC